jgi:hypothetical protein
MKKYSIILVLFLVLTACEKKQETVSEIKVEDKIGFIDTNLVNKTINILIGKFKNEHKFRIKRGVSQVAEFWKRSDGEYNDFEKFCVENFIADEVKLNDLFETIQRNQEIINGNFHRMMAELQEPVQLDQGPISKIEYIYSAYDATSHLKEDLFQNKAAFITLLNFPHYNLKEKNTLSNQWDNTKWAYARMGDLYTSRVPADVLQEYANANSEASAYIDSYNIYMGKLLDEEDKTPFPKGMKLITHWNLRDELKSQYSEENGIKKQKMIYNVMKHIVNQTIPKDVIDNDEFYWILQIINFTEKTKKRSRILILNQMNAICSY